MKRRKREDDETPDRPGAPVVDEPPGEASGMAPVDPTASQPGGSDLDALRTERDELKDRLLRRAAEFDNYRKRVERDRAQAGVEATAALLKALIPSLDNLERALGAEAARGGALREGVELTYRDLLAALQVKGLIVEDPAGQRFDPTRHEALSHEPAPGFAEGDVVNVLRKGYSFSDRLLRPALVTVAKGEDGSSGTPGDKVH
jgi:molecular chaperone GrpE